MAKHKNPFEIINDLKEHATYLEGIAQAPISPEFAWRLERAARVMRKASRMLELEDSGHIPFFLQRQAN